MPRQSRNLQANFTYHITLRCNNRQFNLNHPPCRDVLLYAIRLAKGKFHFRLYGLCIMSNHVHYLLEPHQPQDLPRLMHWINWYTAMCFNRMLNRSGHFWEQRYFSDGFPTHDHQRALNTLRYIHANPKAAGIRTGFSYGYNNYGTYASLTDDGLTEWHPAFFAWGETLERCAARYRGFCRVYHAKHKPGGWHSPCSRLWLPDARLKTGGCHRAASAGLTSFWQMQCQVTHPVKDYGTHLYCALETAKRFRQANSTAFYAL